jgi:hypothetical protein
VGASWHFDLVFTYKDQYALTWVAVKALTVGRMLAGTFAVKVRVLVPREREPSTVSLKVSTTQVTVKLSALGAELFQVKGTL